jgi:hypothetical protein
MDDIQNTKNEKIFIIDLLETLLNSGIDEDSHYWDSSHYDNRFKIKEEILNIDKYKDKIIELCKSKILHCLTDFSKDDIKDILE